ncbi:LysR family transcriptional regulator [Acidithiobacillus sp. M4-SHS-6]|uniref:LysR family transcriptional regulator n=1 Tax=Acidithiobacillus sp. M4-SHS-6 TaxID=3383024 RepID=UPI0039BEAEDB
MMADDEQLLSLLAVAEHGSISAAAEYLHRGQSAISERLRKLTEYVGEPLYSREINGVKLTRAGAILIPDIERLRRVMRDIDSVIARRQRLMEGELNIVSTSLIANYFLPPYLTRFRQQYPGIDLYIKSGECYWKDVAAGDVDVFFYEGDGDLPELPDYFESTLWQDNEIVIATPLHHPLAGRKAVSFEELQSYPIIWREPGSAIRGTIEKEFARCDIVSKHLIEVADIESVGAMINAGVGIGFMSRRMVEQRSDWQISTATLENHQMVRLNFMAVPQPDRCSKMLEKFLELIQEA